MDIRDVDLNLLVVFDALADRRSVTRAAEALSLSQPATSAALARLRRLFDDPLFVKAGTEMRATPRAEQLVAPVRQVLSTVRSEILQARAFDPATTRRAFSVITPDIGEVNFLPGLLTHMAAAAPEASVHAVSMPRHAAAMALESGSADLAIGYFPDLQSAGFYQQRLFRNEHVCLVRKGHPAIRGKLSLRQFLDADHAVVRPEGREHVFEQFLQATGVQRRVRLQVAHFMSLLPIITGSDLVATVPRDIAEVIARHGSVQLLETPMKSPVIDVHQYWHRRYHRDTAIEWLRGVVNDLFSTGSRRQRRG